MQTTTDEIAPDVFRISTFVPEVGPTGFTFNQFLIRADEPLLFHTGPRAMFPAVHGAAAKLIPINSLRWITFGHIESDENVCAISIRRTCPTVGKPECFSRK
jgi:flavorubredoxin